MQSNSFFREKPKLITVGASAYPRVIDFERMGTIAKGCGALLLADIAHIAGLVAAGLHPSPVPHADFVTTTTHKTLRGPRGGLIMCKEEHGKAIDSAVFPGNQGGPLMHVIAAKATCFKEAAKPSFQDYQQQVINNSASLATSLSAKGFHLVSGGSDNHLMLLDLRNKNITGKEAEAVLGHAGITVNKNMVPYDDKSPFVTSGIRLGTAAITTRGLNEKDMETIVGLIDEALSAPDNAANLKRLATNVSDMMGAYPLYKD